MSKHFCASLKRLAALSSQESNPRSTDARLRDSYFYSLAGRRRCADLRRGSRHRRGESWEPQQLRGLAEHLPNRTTMPPKRGDVLVASALKRHGQARRRSPRSRRTDR